MHSGADALRPQQHHGDGLIVEQRILPLARYTSSGTYRRLLLGDLRLHRPHHGARMAQGEEETDRAGEATTDAAGLHVDVVSLLLDGAGRAESRSESLQQQRPARAANVEGNLEGESQ